ncbi:NADH-quinone oxidoreductase subunit J [Endothiovibrio diazotrophicus]
MSFEQIIFYFFAAILVFAGLRVITARNPVHAALFLVLCFVTSSALWMLLEAEFLALTLVLVYVGAVMVLFLFVVMMLDINQTPLQEGFAKYLPLGGTVALIVVAEMALVIYRNVTVDRFPAPAAAATADYSNTKALGSVLYTDYVYSFEVAAMILLIAIVAAISLTLRRRPETKKQTVGEQVKVRAGDRLRMVKMAAEKKQ